MDFQFNLNNSAVNGRWRSNAPTAKLGYINRPTPMPSKRISDFLPSKPLLAPQESPAPKSVAPSPQLQLSIAPLMGSPVILAPAPTTSASIIHRTNKFKPGFIKSSKDILMYALVGGVFAFGLMIGLQGLHTNHVAQAEVAKLTSKKSNNGSQAPPSTVKPGALAVASYSVAPDMARYIDIPRIQVHARVLSVGLTYDGSLATPNNVYDTAWYNGSSKPGQAGAAVIDGHISSWTTKGVFYGLKNLKTDDKITITKGDGTTSTYGVVKTQLSDAKATDMASLMISADTSKPGLNLISCSGDVIPGTNDFSKRITVYAVQN